MIKRNSKGQFVKGSNGQWLNKCHTEQSKKKIRETFKKKGIGFQYGYIPWNKGMKMSKEYREKLSDAQKGRIGYWKNKRSPNWKGGKWQDKEGYIHIYKPNHFFTTKIKYIFEHRFVAEKCLGRYLTPLEIVHHINEITNDNRPENLYLFATKSEHTRFHQLKIKPKLVSNLTNH